MASIGTGSFSAAISSRIFYITPIGEENYEPRHHADFLMEYIVTPAVAEFGLTVVRADQIAKAGMIGKQVIEHILKARLVTADLSFHNPNVFYELCPRHAIRLPTVQIKRRVDTIPFDLNQYRTIPIETPVPPLRPNEAVCGIFWPSEMPKGNSGLTQFTPIDSKD
jgi:hypothetical protein